MLIYNIYLKELGIKKTDFPFKASHENKLDKKRGVVICQTWNLHFTLACEIYTYLKSFKEYSPGYPVHLKSKKEWNKILDEICEGLREYIILQKLIDCDDFINSKRNQEVDKKFKKSMTLLIKYWDDLWW